MAREASVHRISAGGPDDMAGLDVAVQRGDLDPAAIVAILGKTEGNGCVNDFTRGFATASLDAWLRRHAVAAQVALVMSGGTEGALSPHWIVVETRDTDLQPGPAGALAVGCGRTADLPPEAIGRPAQVLAVADAVREVMADAGIDRPDDVHLVQVKCPLLTAERIRAAEAGGGTVATRGTLRSMALSRGASALGVALALGELAPEALDDAIGGDAGLWCSRASCSAGSELLGHEVVVFGMSGAWRGTLAVDHAVMADALDVGPVRAALARLGLAAECQLDPAGRDRLVALLAKVEASRSGAVRGSRHVMLDDSDIAATRHARAFVGGVLAGLVGHTELFVSGGAEHQGPDGGGPVAIIARRADERRPS
jgi:cyanuric acid amidohydrolase